MWEVLFQRRPYVAMKVSPVLSSRGRFGGLDFCFALVHFTPPTASKNDSCNSNYSNHSFILKMNKTKALISVLPCEVHWIISLICLHYCKMKLESIIQSTKLFYFFKNSKRCCLLLFSLNTCRPCNSLCYILNYGRLCEGIFVLFFPVGFVALIGWGFFGRKMFLSV